MAADRNLIKKKLNYRLQTGWKTEIHLASKEEGHLTDANSLKNLSCK